MNHCPDEVANAVTEILRRSLLRVRNAAGAGDAALCFIEADHVHNLPSLLANYSEEVLRFYLEVEREAYQRQVERHAARHVDQRDVSEMRGAWDQLERYLNSRRAAAPVAG